MDIREFVEACGIYTDQKQKLASLIIGVNQASVSNWLKSGVLPVKSAIKANKKTHGIMTLSECNLLLKDNGIIKPQNEENVLKTIIRNGKFNVTYLPEMEPNKTVKSKNIFNRLLHQN